jgi:GT2 family glycosyltransferase
MNGTTLSIVIVNWRSKDYLRGCLRAVAATCADGAPEIIVVDGASFDGCGEMLAAEFPHVRFIQSEENIGFGQCNNLGFSHATGDVILLLNPDTELQPGSVARLMRELASRPRAGLIAPRLLNSDRSLQTSCVQAFPTPLNQALDSDFLRALFPGSRLWGTGKAFRSREPVVVEAVSGACMLIPSGVYRQLGGFSGHYFMYGEDIDLCYRLRLAGYEVVHVPEAEVVHHGSASSSQQVTHFSTVLIRATNFINLKVNRGRLTACWYRFLQMLSAVIRLVVAAPFAVLPIPCRLRTVARRTLLKWWYILQWAVGIDRVGRGLGRPAGSKACVPVSRPPDSPVSVQA